MEPWFIEAKSVGSVDVDVCFCIQGQLVEPLVDVAVPREEPSLVRSCDAEGRVAELAAYYKDVVRLARKHGKSFSEVRQYFWLRLSIWNSAEGVYLGFPWYDTVEEMAPLLDGISGSTSGEIFCDRDQSWEMQVHADPDFVYAREWDPDDEVVQTVVKIPRAAIAIECSRALERVRKIVRCLAQELGDDVWTKHKSEATFLSPPNPRLRSAKKRWWSREA
jgi:hypothetical protein